MNYLSFDTTDQHLKVLLCAGGRAFFHEEQSPLSHSQKLLIVIDDLLKGAAIPLCEIEAFGVVIGPGSFTGIRIGIATAKGLAAPRQSRLIAVNSRQLAVFSQGLPAAEGFKACFDAAVTAGAFVSPQVLMPLYLQNSQAEGEFKLTVQDITGEAKNGADGLGYLRRGIVDSGVLLCSYEARICDGECELHDIGVGYPYRRLGLSGLLMDDLIAAARGAGCGKIYLEVRDDNAAALALYRRQGFCQTGLRKKYYNGVRDAVLMELAL